jgi:hypothetical protein
MKIIERILNQEQTPSDEFLIMFLLFSIPTIILSIIFVLIDRKK